MLEAAAGAGAGIGVVPEAVATSAITDAHLGEDQEVAVRGLLSGEEQVALLVGRAGSGKSRALWAARAAWEASGHEVLGAAPSAMAADVLEEAVGIASDTLTKLLGELERGQRTLPSRSVVVVDEAGMPRSDDLARLVTFVQATSAKLVLVGDPHQLVAIGPGGLFRTLVHDHGATSSRRCAASPTPGGQRRRGGARWRRDHLRPCRGGRRGGDAPQRPVASNRGWRLRRKRRTMARRRA